MRSVAGRPSAKPARPTSCAVAVAGYFGCSPISEYITWRRVNRFLSSPRIAGKVLYEMNVEELGRVERLLRSMHNKGYVYRREAPAAPARETSRPVVLVVNPTASGPVN